ncbi:MAG TPA: hypothetical protein VGC39_07690 [Candidatus Methylacidiphilales bacterium]
MSCKLICLLGMAMAGCLFGSLAGADDDSESNVVVASPVPPIASKIKGVDADNHTVIVNKPGPITLLLGTNEDTGDAARVAGKAMYIFQGRPDFQLMVVVDLRDSIASWVPSIVLDKMRSNLDAEAIELKPYYLKNGNKSNPRESSHVIADFNGSIFPQLGWPDGSDSLRGILFGGDGREIKRWSKIQNMTELQNDVRAAIEALDAAKAGKSSNAVPRAQPAAAAP